MSNVSVAIKILDCRPGTFKPHILELWRARLRGGNYPPVKVLLQNEKGLRVISGDILLAAAKLEGLTRVKCEFL